MYTRFLQTMGPMPNNALENARSSASTTTGSSAPPASSQNSPPVPEMSVKDLVAQPGRDHMPKLDPSGVNGTWFHYSNNGITKSMLKMYQHWLDKAYEDYELIPSEKRDQFFRCFAQDFTWDRSIHEKVELAYHAKAKSHYSSTLHGWKKAIKNRGEVPKMKKKTEFWKDILEYWDLGSTASTSSRQSKNRMSQRGGIGIATHNAGSTSIPSLRENLRKQTGVEPDWATTLETLHTNKKTKMIQDPVAAHYIKTINDEADIRLSQISMDGSVELDALPASEINKIVEETIPIVKGRRFGLGKTSNISKATATASTSQTQTEEMQQKIVSLQKTLLEKDEHIKMLDSEVDKLKTQGSDVMSFLKKKFPENFPATS